jgi:hypothetical protein
MRSTYLDLATLRVLVLFDGDFNLNFIKDRNDLFSTRTGHRNSVVLRIKCVRILREGNQAFDTQPETSAASADEEMTHLETKTPEA